MYMVRSCVSKKKKRGTTHSPLSINLAGRLFKQETVWSAVNFTLRYSAKLLSRLSFYAEMTNLLLQRVGWMKG